MVARHEDKIDFGNASYPFGANGFNPAQSRPVRKLFVILAVDFTGQTPDAFCAVMKEIIFTHGFLLVCSKVIRFKKPVSL
jgi:hypothetical protein